MKTLCKIILIISALLAVTPNVRADDYELALKAAKAGNKAEAKKILKSLSDKGDARAQAELGGLLIAGAPGEQDTREGVRWIRSAAVKGNAIAQYNLGSMYLEGRLIPLDYKEAMNWLLKAASQNIPEAQLNIASMFADGEGVPQDFMEAAKWLKLAAANGNSDAQMALGRAYLQGIGVEKDLMRGFMWAQIATESTPMTESERKSIRDLAEKSFTKDELVIANQMMKKCRDSKYKDC